MDPDAFTAASLFKWDPIRAVVPPPPPPPPPQQHPPSTQQPQQTNRLFEAVTLLPPPPVVHPPPPPPASSYSFIGRPRELLGGGGGGAGGLEDFFQAYGIRYYTAAKIVELGFTVSTLLDMKDEELDEMMNSLSHIFRWELLVGERYGIKAAVRAERRRLLEEDESRRRTSHFIAAAAAAAAAASDTTNPPHNNALDALSQEGLSEEPVQQQQQQQQNEKEAAGSGGGWEVVVAATEKIKKQRRRKAAASASASASGTVLMRARGKGKRDSNFEDMNHNDDKIEDDDDDKIEDDEEEEEEVLYCGERQREHPFIVTEPGEVARGKKNGLDYLFHLYEQCRDFLIEVQNIAKERGEKCPTKVTNQVFRYAKKAGASYINKPKMRHYVHCYALHCLDEEASNELRRVYKERGENVGAWRQACYKPLVQMAALQGFWDIDGIFNSHPRLSIWYVPTKLRQLCHAERNNNTTITTTAAAATATTNAATTNTNNTTVVSSSSCSVTPSGLLINSGSNLV